MPSDLSPAIDPLLDDDFCFGCGAQNPIGLRLTFAWNGDLYWTRWTPAREHQGWAGRLHGGLAATVLDEILTRAALERHGLDWVTAELTTRLRRPIPVGTPLHIQARIKNVRPKLILCVGEILDETSGEILATGAAKLMRAR